MARPQPVTSPLILEASDNWEAIKKFWAEPGRLSGASKPEKITQDNVEAEPKFKDQDLGVSEQPGKTTKACFLCLKSKNLCRP